MDDIATRNVLKVHAGDLRRIYFASTWVDLDMPAPIRRTPYPFMEVSASRMCASPDAPPIALAVEALHHELCQIVRNMPVIHSPLPKDLDHCSASMDSVRCALDSARKIMGQLNRERAGACFCLDPGEMMCMLYISVEACRWLVEVANHVDSRTDWMLEDLHGAWRAWQTETQRFQGLVRSTCTTFSNTMNAVRYGYVSGDSETLYTLWLNEEDRARFQLLQGDSPQGEYDRIVGHLNCKLQNDRASRAADPRTHAEDPVDSTQPLPVLDQKPDSERSRTPMTPSKQTHAYSESRVSWPISEERTSAIEQ
ncbi:hypothetical protein PENSPDRAFT_688062 [Peniophora sp. CONT]|nr:hypothetical protein PENSPDRAFT_688062 [Peniophora sp. CONT]